MPTVIGIVLSFLSLAAEGSSEREKERGRLLWRKLAHITSEGFLGLGSAPIDNFQ